MLYEVITGGDLAVLGAGVEVLHHLQAGEGLGHPGDMHLPLQGMPGEQQTDLGIAGDLLGLAAAQVVV